MQEKPSEIKNSYMFWLAINRDKVGVLFHSPYHKLYLQNKLANMIFKFSDVLIGADLG